MSRLPIPGSDKGTWGDILNDYLAVSHNPDGTLTNSVVDASRLQDASVTTAKIASGGIAESSITNLISDLANKVATSDPRLTDARTPTAHNQTASTISDSTAIGREILTAADAPTARATLGAGTSSLALGSTTGTALDAAQASVTYTAVVETVNTVSASGANQTILAPVTATISYITLTAACTLVFPIAVAGASFTLVLVQDATGSRLVTWPNTVSWPAGAAPTLSVGASKVDYLTFICVDGTTWAGFVSGLDIHVTVAGDGVLFADDFERADATGIAAVGNGWEGTSTTNIVNGDLIRVETNAYQMVTNPAQGILPADYTVTAHFPAATIGSFMGIFGRWYNGHGVRVMTYGNNVSLAVGDASYYGQGDVTISTPNFPASWVNKTAGDHTLALRMTGTTVDVLCDGQLVTTCTIDINTTVTGTGFGICGEGQGRAWSSLDIR